uniref:PPUP8291 n=1 Tax=Poeciliopsis prolifica TaxID=188132 RepID=A0A0S7EW67_9TELE
MLRQWHRYRNLKKRKVSCSSRGCSTVKKTSQEDDTLETDEQIDKAAVISDPPSVKSSQQEANAVDVPVKSEQLVLTSTDIIETKPSDKTSKEKDCEGEVEAGLSATKYQNESEEVEPPVKDREAETNKKEDESQAVVGSLQEAISVSEASAVCDKDCNTVFDVEVSSLQRCVKLQTMCLL